MRSSDPTRRPAGGGSLRERRPGVWEVRIRTTAGPDGHRSCQRSVTVRGAEADAHAELVRLTAARPQTVALTPPSLITLAEVLARWLAADHPWKPSTLVGYRSVVGFLSADPIARVRAEQVLPAVVRAAVSRWEGDGASAAVIGGRFRVLRAALSWAYDERLLDVHPIRHMRGPGRVPPRRPLAEAEVRALLLTAELLVLEAEANHPRSTGRGCARLAHLLARAEQDLLLVRLAADTGARRGELAALQLADLDGRVLRIDKAVSAGVLTTPKSGHGRTLTLGATTAELWHALHGRWTDRDRSPVGPWLFSARLDHAVPLTAGALGHRFDKIRDAAGVPDATLHRLRHNVATYLVAHGQILQAQARLGHADAATTLREYAYALPLTDAPVADALDAHLNQPRDEPAPSNDPQPPTRDQR